MLQSFFRKLFGLAPDIEHDPMKYLLVGLGNIGSEYTDTRHNIGFLALDHLAAEKEVAFKTEQLGDIAEVKHRGRIYILLKPNTFMNRSGKAVRYWLQKHKIEKDNMLVIVDDLNLSLGRQRLRGKGSDGGHNGLKDIDQMTGGNDYARLRLGIGNEFSQGKQVNYVLGEWTAEEREQLPAILTTAAETALSFGVIGLQYTMNKYN